MKKCMSQVYILFVTVILILLVIQPDISRGLELAQPDSPLVEQDPVISEYARTMAVSIQEAQRRLTLQTKMVELANQIAKEETSYAGSWLLHEPDFRLLVAFAAPDGEERLRKYVDGVEWAALVEARQVIFTIKELKDILNQVNSVAIATGIPFASGINFQTNKIKLYTPKPEELRSQLEAQDIIKAYVDTIEYVYQESMLQPAALKYPYLLGSTPLSVCTAGFVVLRADNNRKAISTAGHCDNVMTVDGINFGLTGNANGWLENDPFSVPPVGPFGDNLDFQVHDSSIRSFDLTNVIRNSASSTASVISSKLKGDTLNIWVCKNGASTGFTCGRVVDVNHSPGYAPGTGRYVLVQNSFLIEIACGAQTFQACGTTAPGSGTIQSYNAYAIHGKLRETIWRNNIGYLRDVPLNATNTNVNWGAAPAWTQCCSGTPPRAQGGDMLNYP